MDAPSRWALRLGSVALALLAIGPLLIHLGLASPFLGFRVFGLGLLLGLITLVVSGIGLWRTRSGRPGRSQALAGFGLGVLVLAIVAFSAREGAGVPPINDITTDLGEPPAFVAIAELEANHGRDMSYPGEEFAEQQRTAYADLEPMRFDAAPAEVLSAVRAAAIVLGWEIVGEDAEAGRLEAIQMTRIFRFVDDVVVRVRPDGSGSIVDVRSKSRDGRGDLGANAARIRTLLAELKS